MEDFGLQEDEMDALKAIYGEEIFMFNKESVKPVNGHRIVGQCLVDPVLPSETISIIANGLSYPLSYLSPIGIKFSLPPDYPSKKPPSFKLFCPWLKDSQLQKVGDHLKTLWSPGEVVLFQWAQWIQTEVLDFLRISFPLDFGSNFSEGPQIENRTSSSGIQTLDSRLRLVLDHDKARKEKDYLNSFFTCGVCFDERLGCNCLKFFSCGHIFCRECLRGYFESQISSRAVKFLHCPDPKCMKQALPTEVRQVVAPEHYAKYESLLLQTALEEMEDIIWCPRKSCSSPVIRDPNDDSLGECSVCRYAFCIRCKKSWHGVEPCLPENLKVILDEYQTASHARKLELEKMYGKSVILRGIAEYETVCWMEENARKCPRCYTQIQRSSGCNKMTCSVCQSYFCYLCGTYLKSNPYDHFSVPSSPCFNRLFTEGTFDD